MSCTLVSYIPLSCAGLSRGHLCTDCSWDAFWCGRPRPLLTWSSVLVLPLPWLVPLFCLSVVPFPATGRIFRDQPPFFICLCCMQGRGLSFYDGSSSSSSSFGFCLLRYLSCHIKVTCKSRSRGKFKWFHSITYVFQIMKKKKEKVKSPIHQIMLTCIL